MIFNELLANIIKALHIFIILFMIIAPFTGKPYLWLLHIVFGLSLLVHWSLKNDLCCLTLLEGQLRGIHTKETFIHSLVSPIYSIDDSNLSVICYRSTILLMLLSSYRLFNNEYFIKAIHSKNAHELFENFKIMAKISSI